MTDAGKTAGIEDEAKVHNVQLTERELGFLHQKANAETLVYLGHEIAYGLQTDSEKRHLKMLRALSSKLSSALGDEIQEKANDGTC